MLLLYAMRLLIFVKVVVNIVSFSFISAIVKEIVFEMYSLFRNRLGFIVLGCSKDYLYTCLLTATLDLILKTTHTAIVGVSNDGYNHRQSFNLQRNISNINEHLKSTNQFLDSSETSHKPFCAKVAPTTIIFLLIVPKAIVIFMYPFCFISQKRNYKIIFFVSAYTIAILMIGSLINIYVVYVGMVLTGVGSAFIALTVLISVSSYGGKVALSGIGIGSGAGQLTSSMIYVVLRTVIPIQVIIYMNLIWPLLMVLTFTVILKPVYPESTQEDASLLQEDNGYELSNVTRHRKETNPSSNDKLDIVKKMNFKQMLSFSANNLSTILPSFFDNIYEPIVCGLFELIYLKSAPFDRTTQFSMLNFALTLGTAISNCCVELFVIKKLWLLTLLQTANMFVIVLHASGLIDLHNYWIIFALILIKGLLTGSLYVNQFVKVESIFDNLTDKSHATSFIQISMFSGKVIGCICAIFIRNFLCSLSRTIKKG